MAATDLHLRQINHFLAIVEEGSLCKAAQKVHLTQPALSKSIRQLEERLQVQLVDRTPKGVVATSYGEAFIDHARAIRAQITSAVAQMREMQGLRTGSVTVAVAPSLTGGIVPEAIARLSAMRPNVTINLTEGLCDTICRGLHCGEFDFVIGARLNFLNSDEIWSEPLYEDRCVIVARPNHPIARRSDLSLEHLRDYGWVLTRKEEPLRAKFDEIFLRNDIAPPDAQVLTNSVTFMRQILHKTDLLGFLPHLAVRDDERAGQLAVFPHPECTWERTMSVAHRRDRTLSPLSRLLIRTIRQISEEALPTLEFHPTYPAITTRPVVRAPLVMAS